MKLELKLVLSNAFLVTHHDTLIKYLQDQHVPKCLVGPVIEVEVPPVTGCHSSFVKTSSKHLHNQTLWARDLKIGENVHHPLCFRCHMLGVMCQVSGVKGCTKKGRLILWNAEKSKMWRPRKLKLHLYSCVRCGMSCVTYDFLLLLLFFLQSGWASRWRVCLVWENEYDNI